MVKIIHENCFTKKVQKSKTCQNIIAQTTERLRSATHDTNHFRNDMPTKLLASFRNRMVSGCFFENSYKMLLRIASKNIADKWTVWQLSASWTRSSLFCTTSCYPVSVYNFFVLRAFSCLHATLHFYGFSVCVIFTALQYHACIYFSCTVLCTKVLILLLNVLYYCLSFWGCLSF